MNHKEAHADGNRLAKALWLFGFEPTRARAVIAAFDAVEAKTGIRMGECRSISLQAARDADNMLDEHGEEEHHAKT